jgi:hypothetical protein
VRWTSQGSQRGEFRGLPPTGNQVPNSGISVFRIPDGKVEEVWDTFYRLWMWRQPGIPPEIKDAIAKAREAMLSRQSEMTE